MLEVILVAEIIAVKKKDLSSRQSSCNLNEVTIIMTNLSNQ